MQSSVETEAEAVDEDAAGHAATVEAITAEIAHAEENMQSPAKPTGELSMPDSLAETPVSAREDASQDAQGQCSECMEPIAARALAEHELEKSIGEAALPKMQEALAKDDQEPETEKQEPETEKLESEDPETEKQEADADAPAADADVEAGSKALFENDIGTAAAAASLKRRVHEHFGLLVQSGCSPNRAAAQAILAASQGTDNDLERPAKKARLDTTFNMTEESAQDVVERSAKQACYGNA